MPNKNLPVTPSTSASGWDFKALGLKGMSWFLVFAAWVISIIATDDFLAGSIIGIAAYLFVRIFIDEKPRYWLLHVIGYRLVLPKHFIHRPRSLAFRTRNDDPLP